MRLSIHFIDFSSLASFDHFLLWCGPVFSQHKMYSLGWILTLFIRDSPLTFAVRVWDVFLSYGWSTFFSVALAVLYKARRELMQCKTFERAMLTLKSIVSLFKREKILKYVWHLE